MAEVPLSFRLMVLLDVGQSPSLLGQPRKDHAVIGTLVLRIFNSVALLSQ